MWVIKVIGDCRVTPDFVSVDGNEKEFRETKNQSNERANKRHHCCHLRIDRHVLRHDAPDLITHVPLLPLIYYVSRNNKENRYQQQRRGKQYW